MKYMSPQVSSIPGVVLSSSVPTEPPMLLVVGPEKSGKSGLSMSLIGWRDMTPLVVAFDKSGPDTCTDLGYPVPSLRPDDQVSVDSKEGYWGKVKSTLSLLEANFSGPSKPHNAIVIDCASTMVDKLMIDDQRINPGKDRRRNYMNVLTQGREIINRMTNLGVPTIWLTWLQAPFIEEEKENGQKKKRQVLGGPMVDGQKLRSLLAGKAHMIFVLEKVKRPANSPDACSDGYARVLHSKTWDFIEAGGRYSSRLPEPCPGHLGWILDQIMGLKPAGK